MGCGMRGVVSPRLLRSHPPLDKGGMAAPYTIHGGAVVIVGAGALDGPERSE